MSIFVSPRFLSRVIWADATSCAATGALQLTLADALAPWTGLPASLLAGTGAFLLVYAGALVWLARQPGPPRSLIRLVILGNLGWAVACGALPMMGVGPLTGWGIAWLAAQVVVVLVLADLQWAGLRRQGPGVTGSVVSVRT